MTHPKIERVKCPRRCGWYRDWTNTETWLRSVVDHPLLGRVTEATLLSRDVYEHDCDRYTEAYQRVSKIHGEK